MRTPAEVEQLKMMLKSIPTFRNVFMKDWTDNVITDLKYRLNGKIPRNFVVNISGGVGTPTGIFKSSMGLQIALHIDPTFSLQQRVGFSVNQLLEKLQTYSEYKLCNQCFIKFSKTWLGEFEYYTRKDRKDIECDNCPSMAETDVLLRKMVFFLDEQTKTLKQSGLIRLSNIIDTARQRQICFITCGVDQYGTNFTTFNLKRVQETHDNYLPEKKVRYAVYDDNRDIYYGYFDWEITPLSNPKWRAFWKDYSKMKTDFQRVAIAQQIQTVNFEEMAEKVMNNQDFVKCFFMQKNGQNVLRTSLAKTMIIKMYPDITNEEREHVLSEIKMILYDE